MKFLTHPLTTAFGLANLYLLSLSGPLISPDHDLVYHLIGSGSSIFLPVITYLVVLWLLLAALLTFAAAPQPAPGHHPRRAILLWYLLVAPIPWSLLHTIAGFADWLVPLWLDLLFAALLLAGLAAALFFQSHAQRAFRRLHPPVATLLGFLALSGVLILAQLVTFARAARNLNPPTALHHTASSTASHPRILWIVLDELSYQQVYERRFAGLALPAFDQFAAQSTSFTQVVPTGRYTHTILPTLLTGLPSDRIRVDARGMLLALHSPATAGTPAAWHRFDPHQTVFQDALDAGYSTGLAGWYNPYCRILPNVLDSCYWVYHEATPASLSPNRTASRNLLRPFRRLIRRVHSILYRLHLGAPAASPPSGDLEDIRMHSADYRDLLAAGDHLLSTPSIDFVFLHLPIPHPYGFYDRRTRSIATAHTSYIDNLALADTYLAHVRTLLQLQHPDPANPQQNAWDQSAILLMGDHSWRTSFVWKDSNSWTAEDALASHDGQFDPRPAYLLKLPNQHQPAHIDAPYDALRTRALLDALLSNRLHTPDDLAHWAATTPSRP